VPPVREGDERRWHYRRSLASRVTLLTTMAVGLAVAFVAMGAYVTVRMQLQSSLDQSLLDRAHQAASSNALADLLNTNTDLPSAALGAADVRIALVTPGQQPRSNDHVGPTLELGQPRSTSPSGGRRTACAPSPPTGTTTAWSRSPWTTGRPWCWPSPWPRSRTCWTGSAL